MEPQNPVTFQGVAIYFDDNDSMSLAIRYSIHSMGKNYPDISHFLFTKIVQKFLQSINI